MKVVRIKDTKQVFFVPEPYDKTPLPIVKTIMLDIIQHIYNKNTTLDDLVFEERQEYEVLRDKVNPDYLGELV